MLENPVEDQSNGAVFPQMSSQKDFKNSNKISRKLLWMIPLKKGRHFIPEIRRY